MDDEILTIYCLCDDMLQAIGHQDNSQCRMSSAEVMTVAIVAALHFGGNFAKARGWLHSDQRIPIMLGKSRYSRRLHRISHHFITLFQIIGQTWKELNTEQVYLVDTFPIPVCDNIRIKRCRIYPSGNGYRGYKSSKRRYFYGLKLHLIVTEFGQPVEFMLSPGSMGDVTGLYGFD
ncbi:MAG: transposase [Candidatus Promineifilaceae bacterium]